MARQATSAIQPRLKQKKNQQYELHDDRQGKLGCAARVASMRPYISPCWWDHWQNMYTHTHDLVLRCTRVRLWRTKTSCLPSFRSQSLLARWTGAVMCLLRDFASMIGLPSADLTPHLQKLASSKAYSNCATHSLPRSWPRCAGTPSCLSADHDVVSHVKCTCGCLYMYMHMYSCTSMCKCISLRAYVYIQTYIQRPREFNSCQEVFDVRPLLFSSAHFELCILITLTNVYMYMQVGKTQAHLRVWVCLWLLHARKLWWYAFANGIMIESFSPLSFHCAWIAVYHCSIWLWGYLFNQREALGCNIRVAPLLGMKIV